METAERAVAKLSYYTDFKNNVMASGSQIPLWSCDPQSTFGDTEQMFNLAINWENGNECPVSETRPVLEVLANCCRMMAARALNLKATPTIDELSLPIPFVLAGS